MIGIACTIGHCFKVDKCTDNTEMSAKKAASKKNTNLKRIPQLTRVRAAYVPSFPTEIDRTMYCLTKPQQTLETEKYV